MLKEILSPLNLDAISYGDRYAFNQMANHIKLHHEKFPDLSNVHLAIIGVEEDRNAVENKGCAYGLDDIRRQFYRLYNQQPELGLADLGNIKLTEKVSDSYTALQLVIQELREFDIIPIILGGSHDLTYGQYMGLVKDKGLVNLAVIDEKINLYHPEETLNNESFLYKILDERSKNLFNLSLIAYQEYLVDPMVRETLQCMHFDQMRLGRIKEDYKELEPVLRNADLVSFDIGAIKMSDGPAKSGQTPNGLTGEEACQISWYSGISDRLSCFGIYEYHPEFDYYDQTSQLIAQMIWHFVEGFYQRKGDSTPKNETALKYTVNFEHTDHQIEFIKSKKSDRWWMKVPILTKKNKKLNRHQLVPCSYNDYLNACNEEIPERWMRAYLKINNWGENRVV